MLKRILLVLTISLTFAACNSEPETNQKKSEGNSAAPAASATQTPATAPSPAATSTPTPAASPAKPESKENEK